MKKIITILGTRPEIIRLSLIIKKIDKFFNHILINTCQNYDINLNNIFFDSLELRKPDYTLNVKSSTFGEQISKIILEIEKILLKEKPDGILILGDTNSGLSSFVAKRMGIPVFHLEAGNRCYDNRVPEEVNRLVIDHCSSIYMPYTYRSMENLLKEGIRRENIFVVGNPIYEVMRYYAEDIFDIANREKNFFLVTMHREENVNNKDRLSEIFKGLSLIYEKYEFPIICSLHPRTRSKIEEFGIDKIISGVHLVDPLGFLDFLRLEANALCVITDSGTVQEECCIFSVPNVTIRDVTERPETMEAGSNILSGCNSEYISKAVDIVLNTDNNWVIPNEYLDKNVSEKVVKIIYSYFIER